MRVPDAASAGRGQLVMRMRGNVAVCIVSRDRTIASQSLCPLGMIVVHGGSIQVGFGICMSFAPLYCRWLRLSAVIYTSRVLLNLDKLDHLQIMELPRSTLERDHLFPCPGGLEISRWNDAL
jgi:hypothetical protein